MRPGLIPEKTGGGEVNAAARAQRSYEIHLASVTSSNIITAYVPQSSDRRYNRWINILLGCN